MRLTLNRVLAGVSATARQPDTRFARDFPDLVASVERAFRHEENLAEATGHAGLRELRQGNALLPGALHRAASQADRGAVAPGRERIAALPDLSALPRQRTRRAG